MQTVLGERDERKSANMAPTTKTAKATSHSCTKTERTLPFLCYCARARHVGPHPPDIQPLPIPYSWKNIRVPYLLTNIRKNTDKSVKMEAMQGRLRVYSYTSLSTSTNTASNYERNSLTTLYPRCICCFFLGTCTHSYWGSGQVLLYESFIT